MAAEGASSCFPLKHPAQHEHDRADPQENHLGPHAVLLSDPDEEGHHQIRHAYDLQSSAQIKHAPPPAAKTFPTTAEGQQGVKPAGGAGSAEGRTTLQYRGDPARILPPHPEGPS